MGIGEKSQMNKAFLDLLDAWKAHYRICSLCQGAWTEPGIEYSLECPIGRRLTDCFGVSPYVIQFSELHQRKE